MRAVAAQGARAARPTISAKESSMKWNRLALTALLFFSLALVGAAGDGNAKKLVGVWESVSKDGELPPGSKVEFTKDGKLKVEVAIGDKVLKADGTYKVAGDKLTVTITFEGESKTHNDTIKSVNDKRLVIEHKSGKSSELKRVK